MKEKIKKKFVKGLIYTGEKNKLMKDIFMKMEHHFVEGYMNTKQIKTIKNN